MEFASLDLYKALNGAMQVGLLLRFIHVCLFLLWFIPIILTC